MIRTFTLLILCVFSSTALANLNGYLASSGASKESLEQVEYSEYGAYLHFDQLPKVLFLRDSIKDGDIFDFRRALRKHPSISALVLDSEGGLVREALLIAGVVSDRGMTTYVPTGALCASACSFIYFAGKSRLVKGALGVHQFSNADNTKRDNVNEVQQNTQYTTSEIIGFLNAFDTPVFVYEEMFASSKMYYFTEEEQIKLSSHESLATLTSVDTFIGNLKQEAELQELKQRIEIIKSLQTELKRLGCYNGLVDGAIGSSTKKALSRYLERAPQHSDWGTGSVVKLIKKLTKEKRVGCIKEKVISAPKISVPKVPVPKIVTSKPKVYKVKPKLNLTSDVRDSILYNDQLIETSAIKAIKNASPLLKTAHVNATSNNGILLLMGQVPTESTKIIAGKKARGIRNVRKVHNELLVSPSASHIVRSSDALITSTIKTRMAREKPSLAKHIKVSTENGIVYLMGLVTLQESDWAVRKAKTASGIQRIVKVFEYIDLDEAPQVANPEAALAAYKAAYKAAYALIRKRQYDASIVALLAFVKNFPQSYLVGNAYYWLGEVYMVQGDASLAVWSFENVISKFPQHRRMPDALYRLAVVYSNEGDATKANKIWQQVIAEYPESSAAKLALEKVN